MFDLKLLIQTYGCDSLESENMVFLFFPFCRRCVHAASFPNVYYTEQRLKKKKKKRRLFWNYKSICEFSITVMKNTWTCLWPGTVGCCFRPKALPKHKLTPVARFSALSSNLPSHNRFIQSLSSRPSTPCFSRTIKRKDDGKDGRGITLPCRSCSFN